MLEGLSAPISFASLNVLDKTTSRIFTGVEGVSAFSHHATLAHFNNIWFAAWSNGAVNEDDDGQCVRFATSADGETWSASGFITPVPAVGWRYSCCGLWVRDNELYAFIALDEVGPYWGDSLAMYAFRWEGSVWTNIGLLVDGVNGDYPPVQFGGSWAFAGRTKTNSNMDIYIGDLGNWTRYVLPNPSGAILSEASLIVLPNGWLSASFRDNASPGSRRLYRSFFHGGLWTAAKRTNFPDARAKNYTLRLSDGRYALISNSAEQGRNPLTLAVSDDGARFDRMYIVRNEPTAPRYPGGSKNGGYQYPYAVESDGYLHVIYSVNKEDVEVSRIAIADIV